MSNESKAEAKTKEELDQTELSEEQLEGAAGGEIEFVEHAGSGGGAAGIAEIDFVEVGGGSEREATDEKRKR